MARGGFLGRIGRAIRNIVAPPPRPSPPREPPPPPPPPKPPPRRDPYREIWKDNKQGKRGDFRKNKAVFDRMLNDVERQVGGEVYDAEEREELWQSYVRNIVNPGPKRRQDSSNPFWRDSGIDPADFRWDRWREAMGYTGKRRSRTP